MAAVLVGAAGGSLAGSKAGRLSDHELAGGRIIRRLAAFPRPPDDQGGERDQREGAESALEHRLSTIVARSRHRSDATLLRKALVLNLTHVILSQRRLADGGRAFGSRATDGLVVLVPGLTPIASKASL